jgi:hypothetical protein
MLQMMKSNTYIFVAHYFTIGVYLVCIHEDFPPLHFFVNCSLFFERDGF